MTGDFDQALTAEEIALLATARELASSVILAERAAMDAATAALKEGRIASYPAPKSRPRLTLKSQEEINRLKERIKGERRRAVSRRKRTSK